MPTAAVMPSDSGSPRGDHERPKMRLLRLHPSKGAVMSSNYFRPRMSRSKEASTVKLAVTVSADVHAKVLVAADAEGKSDSAWIAAAGAARLAQMDGLAAFISQLANC